MADFCKERTFLMLHLLSLFIAFLPNRAAEPLLPCTSNPCLNEGICHNFSDHYVCFCDYFWTGNNCETFKGLPESSCSTEEYQCDNDRCILREYLCDGTDNCLDSTDEKYCSSATPLTICGNWEFDCGEGKCLPQERRCDRIRDCTNGEDERYCGTALTPILPPEGQPPSTPLRPVDPSPTNLVDILIVSCAMLMTFMAITIFIYVRRVRHMQQRYFAAVGHPHHMHHHHHHHSNRRRHHNRSQHESDDYSVNAETTTPYRLSQHSNFCHHLPPHRCPARTNLLVSYNLSTGVHIPSNSDKEEDDITDEIPPTYLEVVGTMSTTGEASNQGDETPPPAYEDLHVVEVL